MMTQTAAASVTSRLGYGTGDADQHLHESAESAVEYLDDHVLFGSDYPHPQRPRTLALGPGR